jgi:hypothetical protein
MAELADRTCPPDLTPVPDEEGATEGQPRPVFTCQGTPAIGDPYGARSLRALVSSYRPSGGGATRLVANFHVGTRFCLSVWDSNTGAFLRCLDPVEESIYVIGAVLTLVAYQRLSDNSPGIAAGYRGCFCIWHGDEYSVRHVIRSDPGGQFGVSHLVAYDDPGSGRTRLVSG